MYVVGNEYSKPGGHWCTVSQAHNLSTGSGSGNDLSRSLDSDSSHLRQHVYHFMSKPSFETASLQWSGHGAFRHKPSKSMSWVSKEAILNSTVLLQPPFFSFSLVWLDSANGLEQEPAGCARAVSAGRFVSMIPECYA